MICWSPQVYHENRDHEIEGRGTTRLRNTVPPPSGACPFVPATVGESHCIRHRETEPDVYNRARTLRTYRQNGHHPVNSGTSQGEIPDTDTYRPSLGRRTRTPCAIIEEFCRICEAVLQQHGRHEDAGLRDS